MAKTPKKLDTVLVEQGESVTINALITSSLPAIVIGAWEADKQPLSIQPVLLLPGQNEISTTFNAQDVGKHQVSYLLYIFTMPTDTTTIFVKEIKHMDKKALWEKIREKIQDTIQRQEELSKEIDSILIEILTKQGLTQQQQRSLLQEINKLSLWDKLILAGLSKNFSSLIKSGITPNLKGARGAEPEINRIEPFFKKGDPKSLLDKSQKWEKDTPYGVAGNNIYVFGRGFDKNTKVWIGTSPGQGQKLETTYIAGLLKAKIPEKIPTGDYYIWVTRGGKQSNAVKIRVYGNAYIMRLTRGLCIKESSWDQGTDSDEIYYIVVVTIGEYYWAYRSQVIEDVDSGEGYPIELQFFGFEGKAFIPYDTVYIDIYAYESDGISEEVEEFVENTVKTAALATCFVMAAVSGGVTAEGCVLDSSAIFGVGGVVADLINSALKISDNDDFIQHKRIALTLEDFHTKASSRKPFIRFDLDGGKIGKHAVEISIEEFRP